MNKVMRMLDTSRPSMQQLERMLSSRQNMRMVMQVQHLVLVLAQPLRKRKPMQRTQSANKTFAID